MGGTEEFAINDIPTDVGPERQEKPAVGALATSDNADQVARFLLRATQFGHGVLVAFGTESETEAVEFAKRFGADVVHVEDGEDVPRVRNKVAAAAASLGYPGLVFANRLHERIDYPSTLERFEESADAFTIAPVLEREGGDETSGVLVAIPAYNESNTIADVVHAARASADAVLVVDDGSEDDTAAVAADAGATVVQHDRNRGYGAALRTAFSEAERRVVDHLVTLDGDGQHDPADVVRLVERQRETGANLVIGSRFRDGTRSEIPLYRRFGLGVINALTNFSFGVVRAESWVGDTQSGLRAYDRAAVRALAKSRNLGDDMSASIDILHRAHRHGLTIDEVGVVVDYDVEDASTVNPIAHGYGLVMNVLNTMERTRPLLVLGLPGFLITLAGFGFGYWGAMNYVNTGSFPIDAAVVSLFSVLVGFLTVFTGVILHSLNGYFDELADLF